MSNGLAMPKVRVCVPDRVLFHKLGGEAVLLNLDSGKYYGLDAVGTRMWTLLTEHGEVEPAYQALLDEFEVGEEQLRRDVRRLVDDLIDHGLLEIDEA
jgi:hypothetical protein